MDYGYCLENGKYALYLNNERVALTDEVGLLFDRNDDVLLSHGPAWPVQQRFNRMYCAYAARPELQDVADGLTFISGRFDVDELNRCIRTVGYVSRLYRKVQAAAAAQAQLVLQSVSRGLPPQLAS